MRTHLPITYGRELARCFYVNEAPSLLMKLSPRAQLAVTRVTRMHGLPTPTASVRPEKSFTIAVHLIDPDFRRWGTWVDGRFVKAKSWVAGGIGIFDLESDPRALRDTAFDCVHYNLPRTTLEAFAEDAGLPRVANLACEQGTRDPALYHLTQIVLPYLGSTQQPSDLFLDHFVLMLCGRLVEAYGSVAPVARIHSGGLARWQTDRVRELIDQHRARDLTLARLAEECGLSASQFARSFKRSFGYSVHRYVILQRVETAKTLLRGSRLRLTDIALQAGFSDQAAFSRTFHGIVGTTAAKWRIQHGRYVNSKRPEIPE
jgi:AraC family transcriptional regulator